VACCVAEPLHGLLPERRAAQVATELFEPRAIAGRDADDRMAA